MHPIFLDESRRAEWLEALERQDPTALAMVAALERNAAGSAPGQFDKPQDIQLARLCLAWLRGDANAARAAREELLPVLDCAGIQDLGKAAHALTAVLAWDFGRDLWDEAGRREFVGALDRIARSFLEISSGNPHNVTNNWWMLTHGGCLLCCIAADGEAGPEGAADLAGLKEWALQRFKAFCAHFGSAGLYHEGSGYIAYTLSMLMPALIAVQRHLQPGILDEFPQLRLSIPSMLVGTAAAAHTDNGADEETFGISLQWNDAGRGCLGLNPFLPGITVAPGQWRGALRTVFDRLLGIRGANGWDCSYRGLPIAVALYPFSATPQDPNGLLPKRVWDQRQGLGMWRSSWGHGDETVVGWYARASHAGGHSQDDAASVRLIAAGRTWICGGGQARARAEWQTVFTHADRAQRPKPAPLAHITCSHLGDHGGVVGMDTRASLSAYSERYLAWRSDVGFPVCLALLDLLDEHIEPPRSWQWNLAFPRELIAEIDPDGRGFSLLDPVRGRLTARFLLDAPDQLCVTAMPGSSRTYANGARRDYPGDGLIRADYESRKAARVLVAMVIAARGEKPAIGFEHGAITIGGRAWHAPFSPAVLEGLDLAACRPNLMRHPAG